jgi:hypothetical protein
MAKGLNGMAEGISAYSYKIDVYPNSCGKIDLFL